jgi:hypothetical protein
MTAQCPQSLSEHAWRLTAQTRTCRTKANTGTPHARAQAKNTALQQRAAECCSKAATATSLPGITDLWGTQSPGRSHRMAKHV